MPQSSPAFTLAPLPSLATPPPSSLRQNAPLLPLCSSRARAPVPRRSRALRRAGQAARQNVDETLTRYRYGAGAAFAGLRRRAGPHALEFVGVVKGVVGEFERGWPGLGGGGGGHGHGGGGGGHGDSGGAGDDAEDDIPSWGAAPGVHVVLRGRCDEAYRSAMTALMAAAANYGGGGSVIGGGKEALLNAFRGSDPSVPLVILLSWMGASSGALARYKAFYEARGCEVHVVRNGLKTAVYPPASRRQAGYVGDLIDVQSEERPVFVHAFSIGTGIYGLLLDKLQREGGDALDGLRKRVTGVVFDSGPAPIFPVDVAKGLHTVCPMVSRSVWEAAAKAFFWVTDARGAFEKGERALAELQHRHAPQLYFYSKNDKVIPGLHHAVENFIKENRRRGVEVYKTFWEKSIHATHLKVHPEDYVGNLDRFVNRCMKVREARVAAAATAAAK